MNLEKNAYSAITQVSEMMDKDRRAYLVMVC